VGGPRVFQNRRKGGRRPGYGGVTLADTTFYLFSFFNALRLFSYLPQIYRIVCDRNGASAISYWTWGSWTAANVSTAA
jgi:hypothetical protein